MHKRLKKETYEFFLSDVLYKYESEIFEPYMVLILIKELNELFELYAIIESMEKRAKAEEKKI